MEAAALFYLTLYLVSVLMSLSTAVVCWQRQDVAGALPYSLVASNQTLWSLFFIIELMAPSKETKLFWDDLQWVTAAIAPVALLWFALRYTQVRPPYPRLFWGLVLAFPLLFMLYLITNNLHGYVRGESWVRLGGIFSELVYEFTPLVMSLVAYSLILMTLCLGLMLRYLLRTGPAARTQISLLLVAFVLPYLGAILSAGEVRLGPQRDVMPLMFGLSSMAAMSALYRWRLFDVTPMARDVVVENLHDEVLVLDGRDRLIYLNPAALRRLGRPAAHLMGRSVEQVYAAWPPLLRSLTLGAENVAFSLPGEHGQTLAYQLRTTCLYDQLGRLAGRVVLINDVSALKQVEQELLQHRQDLARLVNQRTAELTEALNDVQAAKEQLEQRVADRTAQLATQNRELETFAYSVSHDLKAPLRGIDGYSRLLEEQANERLSEEEQAFLNNIRRAAGQMYQLIEDLLAYSRFQRRVFSCETLNLCEVVQSTLREFNDEIERRSVELVLSLDCVAVQAETEGLSQALRNLIQNALKFNRPDLPLRLEIGSRREREACVIWVRDNGIGFDMAYHDRIFDIFQRLHRAEEYPGTGVGLALVRKAVQRMNGQVWAESELGHGAVFYLRLLCADADEVALTAN